MNAGNPTQTTEDHDSFVSRSEIAALLLAWAPSRSFSVDRCGVEEEITVGRDNDCGLQIRDTTVSGRHFRIQRHAGSFEIADLKSTNGTFVNGLPIYQQQALPSGAVIRSGRAVLVFHEDCDRALRAPPVNRFGLAGRFHIASLIDELREAALSTRHILLTGETGSGKELAAGALATMMGGTDGPLGLLAFNAARYASREEATANLFGVTAKAFSGVDERRGLIEQANGGMLFIDEVHNLPSDLQRALLRFMDSGQYSRLGDTRLRRADVRLVLATNVKGPKRGLAADLLNRLRLVVIPSLSERRADIPSIFIALLQQALERCGQDHTQVTRLLSGDHYEALCLDDYRDRNIRGLIDVADRLATRIAAGASPKKAVANVFSENYGLGPVASRRERHSMSSAESRYEQNRALIVQTYRESENNLSETERRLKQQGFRCSRRWLAVFLERWGIR